MENKKFMAFVWGIPNSPQKFSRKSYGYQIFVLKETYNFSVMQGKIVVTCLYIGFPPRHPQLPTLHPRKLTCPL